MTYILYHPPFFGIFTFLLKKQILYEIDKKAYKTMAVFTKIYYIHDKNLT